MREHTASAAARAIVVRHDRATRQPVFVQVVDAPAQRSPSSSPRFTPPLRNPNLGNSRPAKNATTTSHLQSCLLCDNRHHAGHLQVTRSPPVHGRAPRGDQHFTPQLRCRHAACIPQNDVRPTSCLNDIAISSAASRRCIAPFHHRLGLSSSIYVYISRTLPPCTT